MSIGFGAHIPFVHELGITLEKFEGGHSELRFAPRPQHCNSFGVAHGGAVMTLLDITLAAAARSVQPESGIITIEMKTSFLRPAPVISGMALTARGHLLHRTRSMAFAEGAVFDAQGNLCATASGTFKYVPRATLPGHEPGPLPTD
ncbi:MAG: PaaI family thioesterase [Burkholderiaceae bacterium]|jgi:uncharacterized protein (TIGR00369 family)|nr:PaaI family thioesterase [Burkholderiaceae bacterium]